MTNLKNPDDMNEDEVNELSDLLRNQMSGLHFAKETKFIKSKSPWAIGITAATVSAVAISLSLSSGAAAQSWSAQPNTNAGTQSASEASCTSANAAGAPIVLTSTAVADSTGTIPSTATKVDSSASEVVAAGSGTITLSSAPTVQAFDSRGKFAVTVLGGSTTDQSSATIICVTNFSTPGSPVSGVSVMVAAPSGSAATDTFNVTTNQDGTKTAVGFGPLVTGATQVILSVKGLPDAHATIIGDTYAIWWPYDGTSSAVIKQLDADGKILKTVDVPVSNISVGGLITVTGSATLSAPSSGSSGGGTVSSGTIVIAPSEVATPLTK